MDRELSGGCDEHEDDLLVDLPDRARRGHAIHVRHLDVHEDDVVHRLVVADDRAAVFEVGDVEGHVVFFAVAGQVIGQQLARGCFVLDDGDAHHDPALPDEIADGNKFK